LWLDPPAFTAGMRASVLRMEANSDTSLKVFSEVNPYLLMVCEMAKAVRRQPAYLIPLSQSRLVAATIDEIVATARETVS
jgi:hypothetical protein